MVPSEQQSHRQCKQPSADKSHGRFLLNPPALVSRRTWFKGHRKKDCCTFDLPDIIWVKQR